MAEKSSIIPKRPENDNFPMIDQRSKDCLSVSVAFNMPNQRAYGYFHPEFCDSNGKLTDLGRKQSAQFFSYAKHKEYCDAYRETLKKFLGGKKDVGETPLLEIDDKRKDNALKSLLNQAMSLVEKGEDLDAESLKTISEIFRKVGLLKEDVEVQEAPRRYLPERCGSCLYRSFVESHVESGEIENACLRCKALKVAQENGFVYDEKTLLEPSMI